MAVVDITPAATQVFKHQVLNVSVVVANEGTETQTFNVTLYISEVYGWHLVETDNRTVWYVHGENSADFLLLTSTTIPSDSPLLTFKTKYDIENLYDFGFIQVSRDDGATWASLENANTTFEHGSNADPSIVANLPGLTGTSGGWPQWVTMAFDLSDYAGETVLLGFRYMTDLGHVEDGWYIDNVTISGAGIPSQAFSQLDSPPLNAIQTLWATDLIAGGQATLTFSWNTTDTVIGSYSLSAAAGVVRGETEVFDNFYANGVVVIQGNPDLDGDGDVDIFDIVIIAGVYGYEEGDPGWNPKADLVEDGVINIFDVVVAAGYYGQTI